MFDKPIAFRAPNSRRNAPVKRVGATDYVEKIALVGNGHVGFGRLCYIVTHAHACFYGHTFAHRDAHTDLYGYPKQYIHCYSNQDTGGHCNADPHQYAKSYEYSEANRHVQANGYSHTNAHPGADKYVGAYEYPQADQHVDSANRHTTGGGPTWL